MKIKLAVLVSALLLSCPFSHASDTLTAAEFKALYERPKTTPFPDDNPYTVEKETLGKILFFDPRLSGQGNLNCISCHHPGMGWEIGIPKAIGAQVMPRKAQTLYNLAWSDSFFWDGRTESLDQQILMAIASPKALNLAHEEMMNRIKAISGYKPLFEKAFPGKEISKENLAKAIATYMRTLVSPQTPFDRWVNGDEKAVSAQAKAGFKIFSGKANCVACHSGWNFTDSGFHDIGLTDADLGKGKQFANAVPMQHAFKTPTLRNVLKRAPYMHDGSLKTIHDVIAHYENGKKTERPSLAADMHNFSLTDDEKNSLIEFLKTLNSDDPLVTTPNLPF